MQGKYLTQWQHGQRQGKYLTQLYNMDNMAGKVFNTTIQHGQRQGKYLTQLYNMGNCRESI